LKVPITAENVLSEEDVVLKTAEKAVLEPAGSGVTPSGPPKIASPEEAQVKIATSTQLEELAREQYSSTELSTMDRTFTYTVALDKSEDLAWAWGWCASSNEILQENFEHIDLKLTLDGEEVALEDLVSFDGENGGQFCRFYFTVLSDWPAGQHRLQALVTFDAPINDGSTDYPAGSQTFQYDVYIKP